MSGEPCMTVFYDGTCPLCRREVVLYRWLDRGRHIRWLDMSVRCETLAGESFTMAAALELLHVRESDGVLKVGFDAHLAMWDRLPGFRRLAGFVRGGLLRRASERFYLAFTRRRPGLVRRMRAGDHG